MEPRDHLSKVLTDRIGMHRADLEALVRIPSVSADAAAAGDVRRSAEFVRDLLAQRGLDNAQLLEVAGSHPGVYADWLHAGGAAPTVLLYAHHDVQPTGDPALWTSPAFEPTERDGRLFGRGAADDKAGILVHVAAIDAWLQSQASLPVNVKVFIEGEEEIGSEYLGEFLTTYGSQLQADVVVVTDTDNWQVGVPGITYLLRGLIDCEIEVRALDHGLHSGMYGGPVPDPVTALVKTLSTLTDDNGAIMIPGFCDDVRTPTDDERRRLAELDFDEQRFRSEAGMLDGVELVGEPDRSILERMWMRPSVTIIGFDAPAVATSSNTIVPSARGRVSVRLAPGQDPEAALKRLTSWLRDSVPWGLHVTISNESSGAPFLADPYDPRTKPVFDAAGRALESAYGAPVVYQGLGGSIPFVAEITAALGSESEPAPALLLGVEDPDTRAHGIDESLHLGDFAKACLGEALLFAELSEALTS